MCGDTDTPDEHPKWRDVHLVYSISKDVSNSQDIYNEKIQFKAKKLSLKENSIPQIRNTLRGVKYTISVTQPVTLYLALELYVEV